MLQGKELAAALVVAIDLKKAKRGFEDLVPTRLGREFDIAQSSASEWIKYGRVAKKHIPKLLEFFADVVGPEHWGLPFGKREFSAMLAFRQLPDAVQIDLLKRMEDAVAATKDLSHNVAGALAPPKPGNGKPGRDAA